MPGPGDKTMAKTKRGVGSDKARIASALPTRSSQMLLVACVVISACSPAAFPRVGTDFEFFSGLNEEGTDGLPKYLAYSASTIPLAGKMISSGATCANGRHDGKFRIVCAYAYCTGSRNIHIGRWELYPSENRVVFAGMTDAPTPVDGANCTQRADEFMLHSQIAAVSGEGSMIQPLEDAD